VCVAGLFPDALTKDPNSPRKGVGRNLLFASVFPCAFGQRGLCAQSSATKRFKRISKSVRFRSRNFRRLPFFVCAQPAPPPSGGGLFGLRYQPAHLVMLPVSALCSTINLGELEHAVCVAGLFPDALAKDPNFPRKGVGRNLLFATVFPCAFGQRRLCAQSSATKRFKRIRKSVRFRSRNFRRPPFFACA
jgi:hypothetical protein